MIRIDETCPYPLRPLGELVEVLDRMRRPVNASERAGRQGDYPYYGANGQVGTIDEFIFDEELVLVAEDGGFFFDPDKPISYRVSGKCWVNNHAHVLRPLPCVHVDWLTYAIAYQDITHLVKGSTRTKLNQQELRQISIPLPERTEQIRLVARIREMMERVDEAEALRDAAVAEAQHLGFSVLGELELSSTWPHRPVNELILDSQNGRSIGESKQDGNGRVLTLTAVRDVRLALGYSKLIRLEEAVGRQFAFKKGDVFVSRSNTRDLVGLSAVACEDSPANLIYPDLLIRLTVDRAKVLPEFLAFALRFPSSRRQIRERAKGTSQSMVKISGTSLREMQVPVPESVGEQQEVLAALEARYGMARTIKEGLAESPTTALRQAILRKAFAGEL
jgi:type I restriction enzyme S subunit